MKRRAIVVGGNTQIELMLITYGFTIVPEETLNPHLVVFTGGEDITPRLYGERALAMTHYNERRDAREEEFYKRFLKVPKVGICRGGQFLNVMSGGSMWQHVDNHGRRHEIIDLISKEAIKEVVSTHHQMMIPGPRGEVIAIASEATEFISAKHERPKPEFDTEVVFYNSTNSLCFQPHPEYGIGPTRDYFFSLLNYFWEYDTNKKAA